MANIASLFAQTKFLTPKHRKYEGRDFPLPSSFFGSNNKDMRQINNRKPANLITYIMYRNREHEKVRDPTYMRGSRIES